MAEDQLEEKIRESLQELSGQDQLGEQDRQQCLSFAQNLSIRSETDMAELSALIYKLYFLLESKAPLAEVLYLVTCIKFTLQWKSCAAIESMVLLYGYCLLKFEFTVEVQRIKNKEKALYHLMDDEPGYHFQRNYFMERLIQKKEYWEIKELLKQQGENPEILTSYWKVLLLFVLFADVLPEDENNNFWAETVLVEEKIKKIYT